MTKRDQAEVLLSDMTGLKVHSCRTESAARRRGEVQRERARM